MRKVVLYIVFLGLFGITYAQTKKEKSLEQFAVTKELVETGSFRFEAVSINPRTGPQISLVTNDNYLLIDDGQVAAYLPYFGIARAPDYNGSGPILINAKLEKSSLVVKKKRFVYRFRTNGAVGVQEVTMNIGRSGWANVVVRSVGRPSVSYYGRIKSLKPISGLEKHSEETKT